MLRFTRLTNGFSKKIENHIAMVAIHAVYYNFARIHKTLRITQAMACGLSDHVWSLEEIIMMGRQLRTSFEAAWPVQEEKYRMKAFKQIVRASSKVVGGIAVLIFFRAPFSDMGLALTAGSVVVGIASLMAYTWAEPDDDPEISN